MKRIVLSLLIVATSAFAGPEQLLQHGLISPEIIQQIKPQLALTQEQETKMTDIIRAAREKGSPLESAAKEQQQALHQMLREAGTTADSASAQLAKSVAAEAAVKDLQLRTLIALRDVLTPEQQKKALALSLSKKVTAKTDLEAAVKAKANKLRAAVDALADKPTEAMAYRGEEIEKMIKEGDWQSADAALDRLIEDSHFAELEKEAPAPDFSQSEPGDTSLESLQSRFEAVKLNAQEIVSLPLLRDLLKAKDAFEEAKAAKDADKVGRILTWVEQRMKAK
ncbi:MAG: Spy/CpxP family protein refolding chaperone [Verrucomicrobiaceae bacterium]|nr:Spy/CpxP family protein refolding chaperone [Verrucomicrobiaceae bacterium]